MPFGRDVEEEADADAAVRGSRKRRKTRPPITTRNNESSSTAASHNSVDNHLLTSRPLHEINNPFLVAEAGGPAALSPGRSEDDDEPSSRGGGGRRGGGGGGGGDNGAYDENIGEENIDALGYGAGGGEQPLTPTGATTAPQIAPHPTYLFGVGSGIIITTDEGSFNDEDNDHDDECDASAVLTGPTAVSISRLIAFGNTGTGRANKAPKKAGARGRRSSL